MFLLESSWGNQNFTEDGFMTKHFAVKKEDSFIIDLLIVAKLSETNKSTFSSLDFFMLNDLRTHVDGLLLTIFFYYRLIVTGKRSNGQITVI